LPVIGDQAIKGGRQRRNHAEIIVASCGDEHRRRLVEAVPKIEVSVNRRWKSARRQDEVEAFNIGGLASEQLGIEPLDQPSGESDMIGMHMCDDDPRQASPSKRPIQKRSPRETRILAVDTGVDNRPAVPIFNNIDIYVIEPKGQRNTGPKYTCRNFDHLAHSRRSRERRDR
jgi:hypothetical protein